MVVTGTVLAAIAKQNIITYVLESTYMYINIDYTMKPRGLRDLDAHENLNCRTGFNCIV